MPNRKLRFYISIILIGIITTYVLSINNKNHFSQEKLSLGQALAIMYANLPDPNLEIAAAVNPEYCNIKPSKLNDEWNVSCERVPIHRYQKIFVCEKRWACRDNDPGYTDCRSYYWTIDKNGSSYNKLTSDGIFASISDECKYISSVDEDNDKMKELGLTKRVIKKILY